MSTTEPPQAWEPLQAKDRWFHVTQHIVFDGRIGAMGFTAWAVYCAIKAHTNLNDGWASPSQERVAELLGIKPEAVGTATKRLRAMGLLEERKVGRHKEYRLIESIPIRNAEGEVVHEAKATYVPAAFKRVMDEIKAYAERGTNPSKAVTINVHVTVINQGDNSTVNITNVTGGTSGLSPQDLPDLKNKLRLL